MIVYCAKKLADQLPEHVEIIENKVSLFNWSANLIKHGRKQILILSNTDSKYPVVVGGILKKDLKNLRNVVLEAISIQLQYEMIKPEIIQEYLDEIMEVRFAKLSDRKMVAGLVRWEQDLGYRYDLSEVDNGPLPEVSLGLARTPVTIHAKKYEFPADAFLSSLKSFVNEELFESRAIRLRFTLRMRKMEVWRIVTCPLPISYNHLNWIITETFGWHGNQPHYFDIIDKKTKMVEKVSPYFPESDNESFENEVQVTDFDFSQYEIVYYRDPKHIAIIDIESLGSIDGFTHNQPWYEQGEGVANPDDISPEVYEGFVDGVFEDLTLSGKQWFRMMIDDATSQSSEKAINARLRDVIQIHPDTFA